LKDKLYSTRGSVFLAVAALILLLLVTDGLLGPTLPSFIATSLTLALITVLLIRMVLKNSVKFSPWFTSKRLEANSRRGLIARRVIIVDGAARGYYHSRREVASILGAALSCRFGDRSSLPSMGFAYGEDLRSEVERLVGEDGWMMKILDPQESECQRRRFSRRSSEEEKDYLMRLQEVIRFIKEDGK